MTSEGPPLCQPKFDGGADTREHFVNFTPKIVKNCQILYFQSAQYQILWRRIPQSNLHLTCCSSSRFRKCLESDGCTCLSATPKAILTIPSDKNNSTKLQLVYRSQNDPLIHDDSAQDRTLIPLSSKYPSQSSQGLHLADLEQDVDLESMRDNEGEAAAHGVYFDDSEYDYMQHLRDMNEETEASHFVDGAMVKVGKSKGKMMKLEDAMRESSLEDDTASSRRGDAMSFMSSSTRPRTYQDMQAVPDEIAGFQPNMDPRLREVLEALDDEAYIDDKDDDETFDSLVQGAHRSGELDLDDFEALGAIDDDGWESDATEKADPQTTTTTKSEKPLAALSSAPADTSNITATEAEAASAEDGAWLADFARFKDAARRHTQPKPEAAASSVQGPASTLYTIGGTPLRRKKRKGAQTNPSAYSMTSSSLARTEGQRLLDDRFDRLEAMYADDEPMDEDDDEDGRASLVSGASRMSRMSGVSQVSSVKSFRDEGAVREDLEGMMDGFLGDWGRSNPTGARRGKGKKGRGKNGGDTEASMRMLGEIREELGPARIAGRTQKAS